MGKDFFSHCIVTHLVVDPDKAMDPGAFYFVAFLSYQKVVLFNWNTVRSAK